MAVICPTVTAYDAHEYRKQMDALTPFAERIHIDLMDGVFAPTKSPDLHHTWWPHQLQADIHLMYQHPMDYIDQLIKLHPRMVVIHNEASVHHMHFAAQLHQHNIEVGLAILHDTPVEYAYQIMHSFDHVLVFSGKLGYHGGEADMAMLDKVRKIREHHPDVEIGWDGGINDQNARQLIEAGVDVLNVGGFIQKSDDPLAAFNRLAEVIK
ncbi:MAG: rpe [Candidatus Saccharibacteria bacterium]|nr:rpe [Candidatus Saccharibacteria bacterium]